MVFDEMDCVDNNVIVYYEKKCEYMKCYMNYNLIEEIVVCNK